MWTVPSGDTVLWRNLPRATSLKHCRGVVPWRNLGIVSRVHLRRSLLHALQPSIMVGWVGRVGMQYTNHSCCCVEAMRPLATSHSGREQLLIHSLTVFRSTPGAEGFGSRPRLRTRGHKTTRAQSFSIRPTSMPHRGQVRCIACRPVVRHVKKEEVVVVWRHVHGGHARMPAMAHGQSLLATSEGEEEGGCRYETRTRRLCEIVSHGWSLPATKRRIQTPC
jgi:hypothetical protein